MLFGSCTIDHKFNWRSAAKLVSDTVGNVVFLMIPVIPMLLLFLCLVVFITTETISGCGIVGWTCIPSGLGCQQWYEALKRQSSDDPCCFTHRCINTVCDCHLDSLSRLDGFAGDSKREGHGNFNKTCWSFIIPSYCMCLLVCGCLDWVSGGPDCSMLRLLLGPAVYIVSIQ